MKATMTSYFLDDECYEAECNILISGSKIQLKYDDDEVTVIWAGAEHGEGHFHLSRTDGMGNATLHRFVDAPNHFVGTWVERYPDAATSRGAWEVELEEV